MIKLSITHMEIEHCYQCSHCRGVRRFKCALTKQEISPMPHAEIPKNCPLPSKE